MRLRNLISHNAFELFRCQILLPQGLEIERLIKPTRHLIEEGRDFLDLRLDQFVRGSHSDLFQQRAKRFLGRQII